MFVSSFFNDFVNGTGAGDKSSWASFAMSNQLCTTPIGLFTGFVMFEKQKAFVLNVENGFVVWNQIGKGKKSNQISNNFG